MVPGPASVSGTCCSPDDSRSPQQPLLGAKQDVSDPTGTLRLEWDETTELLAQVRRDPEDDEVAELVKVDRASGNRQVYRLDVSCPLHIAGLIRASHRHVLVGVQRDGPVYRLGRDARNVPCARGLTKLEA